MQITLASPAFREGQPIPCDHTCQGRDVPPDPSHPNGPRQGINSFRTVGYRGPCPPPGKPHRYFFRLFARDAAPRVGDRPSAHDLRRAMEGHVLAEGSIMGTCRR